jgi:exodeoxyribonuclease VII small subunit
MTEKAPKKTPKSFEKSLERLETIVADMEGGALSLEDMIARFEEGQGLVRFCSKKLNEVERKIEKLVKKDGEMVAEPLDAEEEPESEVPPKADAADELF